MISSISTVNKFYDIAENEIKARGSIRIVLINCPLDFYSSNSAPKYDTIFPFGLLVLSEITKSKGIASLVIDAEAMRLSIEELIGIVDNINPELVGINLLSPTINIASAIIKKLEKSNRIIVGGGPHASLEPLDSFNRIPEINYLFRGEAENSWTKFLECFTSNNYQNVNSIAGICTHDNSQSGFGKRVIDLDVIPPINRDSIVFPSYVKNGKLETAIISSRGCKEKCNYCSGRILSGGDVRFKSIKSIMEEIENCVNKYGITSFHFADDNFLQNPSYIHDFSCELKRKNLQIQWRSFARVDSLKTEMMGDLVSSGCYRLTFGIESGSPEILLRMNKGHTVFDAEKAIELCKSVGIETKSFFMLGYPEETELDMEMTIDFAVNSKLDWAYFYLVRSFPHTKLYNHLLEKGFTQQELTRYIHWIPNISKGLTAEQLQFKTFLEENHFFNADTILKYNVAHQKSINKYFNNNQLMEIMATAYQKFYYRKEFVNKFIN